ncbi:MAG: FGGY family carbohydrate kinase [Anaerolineales bacterium]|jgi:xylulokinase
MYFLGIDAGTTSLKAALFGPVGQLLALDRQEYVLVTPSASIVELEAETYWTALKRALQVVLAHKAVRCEEIATVCISSQGETFVPVDQVGVPTRRAIVWLDNRATEEARQIVTHFGVEAVFHRTGQPEVAPTWPACKFLWLRGHEPEVFSRTHKFLWLEDYLLYRLTGQFVTECSQQTSSLLLDIQKNAWWPEMMEFVGVQPDHLGSLLKPGVKVGPLLPEAASELGLSSRTLAVTGGMDQVIGALGAGEIAPGMVVESTGGALGIVLTLDRPVFDPQRHIPCHFHVVPDTYCLLPWCQTAGMALKWFRDGFFALEVRQALEAGRDPYDDMTAEATGVHAGCEGLIALPHLEGAFCPEFNPNAKAVFFGATLRHGRPHFTRAILESVAFMLKKNLDLVAGMGIPVGEIRSLGGGARSPLWLQIKADVLQKPVQTVEVEEAACLGAAILGSVASGFYSSLTDAVSHMVHVKKVIEPNLANQEVYQRRYAQYVELYDRLNPMFIQEE